MIRATTYWTLFAALVIGCNRQAQQNSAGANSQASGPSHNNSSLPAVNAPPAAVNSRSVVELDALRLTAPPEWTRQPAGSQFVAAEFTLPRAEGDDADGRLTISTAGGTIEANIDRWKGQFQPQPNEAKQEEVDVSGLTVTVIDFSGDFNDQRGPFAPGEVRPAYRMIAAVVPIDGQLHFIKATGPQKTIATHAAAIHAFIRSAKPTK